MPEVIIQQDENFDRALQRFKKKRRKRKVNAGCRKGGARAV